MDLLNPPPFPHLAEGEADKDDGTDLFEYQSVLSVAKSSGLAVQSDEKRHAETVHQSMQAGF